MLLSSVIVVDRPLEVVNDFFDEPSNLAKWDRSVSEVVVTSDAPVGVGFTFDTIAPSGKRMSYKIIEYKRGERNTIALIDDPIFQAANWKMRYTTQGHSTGVEILIEFKVRPQFFLLNPVLFILRKSLLRDLEYLKVAIEEFRPLYASSA